MRYRHLVMASALALIGGTVGLVEEAMAQSKHFRGNICITTATASCASWDWRVGDCGNARFIPPNWNGSSNRTAMSFHWGYFTQHIAATGSLVGAAFKPVEVSGIGNSLSPYPGSTARIAGQVPASPVTATVFLSNTIIITKFDGIPGCNVSLRFQGQRYPMP